MFVPIPYLRWNSISIDNPRLHSNKVVVNCLVSSITESKYEFSGITHLNAIPQL